MLGRDIEAEIVQRLKIFPNQQWVNDYFNLVQEMIEFTGLAKDDPRLDMSLPTPGNRLPVTLNMRYILQAGGGKNTGIGLIASQGIEQLSDIRLKKTASFSFSPLRGESLLDTPIFLKFATIPASELLKENWKENVLAELHRCKSSPYRRYHQPELYEIAVNGIYRKSIFDQVFMDS